MLISFGVVFFILAKFAFPMITKSVEERKTYVETSLNDAKQAKETLSRVEDDTKALIAEANKEQGRVLNEAAGEGPEGETLRQGHPDGAHRQDA